MFQRSPDYIQTNIFSSNYNLFSGKALTFYEKETAWHNIFYRQVTMRIDESIFKPLYCADNGAPTTCIRTLVAMMILKEGEGLSDAKLFENGRYNMLTRSALGLENTDDPLPTESTYYKFRKDVANYNQTHNTSLFSLVFAQITHDQCLDFDISGKRIRMDSKLLGSNIAWLSRYEVVHETLRLFYKQVITSDKISPATRAKLDELLSLKGEKVVFTCSTEEVKSRLNQLGDLIYQLLPLFSAYSSGYYTTLQRVFYEQFLVEGDKLVQSRANSDISAQSVQSPHDTDCTYRQKNDNKVKGYIVNVTESCDDEKDLNLIVNISVDTVSISDVDFFESSIVEAQAVLPDKIENVHADGAYHSVDNQKFCKENDIHLYLHAIQGAKGRFEFIPLDNGELAVFDTRTNQQIASKKIVSKKTKLTKWRITIDGKHRYFTQQDIDNDLIRKQIAQTPIKTLQKRNNVEATIFQIGYHYSNAKTRYRGLVKHQMWANMRGLWVNFVRIAKYIVKIYQKTFFYPKNAFNFCLTALKFIFVQLFSKLCSYNIPFVLNIHLTTI